MSYHPPRIEDDGVALTMGPINEHGALFFTNAECAAIVEAAKRATKATELPKRMAIEHPLQIKTGGEPIASIQSGLGNHVVVRVPPGYRVHGSSTPDFSTYVVLPIHHGLCAMIYPFYRLVEEPKAKLTKITLPPGSFYRVEGHGSARMIYVDDIVQMLRQAGYEVEL